MLCWTCLKTSFLYLQFGSSAKETFFIRLVDMAPKRKTVGDTLPVKEIKRLKAALQYKKEKGEDGVDELAVLYEKGSKEEKRHILEKYMEDTSLKWRFELTKATVHADSSTSRSKAKWVTKKCIAQAEGLNIDKEEDAEELQILLKQYEERPHEIEELAKKGVKQYRVLKEAEIKDEVESHVVQYQGAVTGADKKSPTEKPQPKAKGEATVEVTVAWKVALNNAKKEGQQHLKKVSQLLAAVQKCRKDISSEHKSDLKEGMRLCEEASDSLEEFMKRVEESEKGHQDLSMLNKQMGDTLECFVELLEKTLPRALPKAKAKAKAKASA